MSGTRALYLEIGNAGNLHGNQPGIRGTINILASSDYADAVLVL